MKNFCPYTLMIEALFINAYVGEPVSLMIALTKRMRLAALAALPAPTPASTAERA